MTCAEFQRKLSAYTDGELSRWTRWKVQQHLGRCADCAGLLEELEGIDVALAGAVSACAAPAYLTDAVMRRLPAMPPPWRRPGVVIRWATASALAGAQLLAVYGAYWWGFAARGADPGPGSRGGLTAVGPLRETPVSRSTAERSEAYSLPGVWGQRESGYPLALPSRVTRPEPGPGARLRPAGAH